MKTISKILVVAFVLFLGVQVLRIVGERPEELHGTLIAPAMPGAEFELESIEGKRSKSEFEGSVLVLAFGFTHCPDVCPTTMATLAQAERLLGEKAADVEVAMITVDPERDTAERLSSYLSNFDETFIGLSGKRDVIEKIAAEYGIFHERAPMDSASAAGESNAPAADSDMNHAEMNHAEMDHGSMDHSAHGMPENYLINHTSTIIGLNRSGKVSFLWPYNISPDKLASDLEYLLKVS